METPPENLSGTKIFGGNMVFLIVGILRTNKIHMKYIIRGGTCLTPVAGGLRLKVVKKLISSSHKKRLTKKE